MMNKIITNGGFYMALIKCTECGKQISDKAESCPNCGYRIESTIEEKKEIPSTIKQEAKEIDKKISICYAIVAVLVVLLFVCVGYSNSEYFMYPFIAAFILMYVVVKSMKIKKANTLGEWNDQYETEENGKVTATICPRCGSNDINISINTVGETYRGRNEVRKKSAVTRSANKKARKGMILATGGLWALTPKKSDYKEIQKGKTVYNQVKICICQKCGSSWNV